MSTQRDSLSTYFIDFIGWQDEGQWESNINDSLTIVQQQLPNSRKSASSLIAENSYKLNGDMLNRPHQKIEFSWVILIPLVSLVLIAISRFYFRKRFKAIFRSALLHRYVNQLQREGNLLKERINIFLWFVFIINFSWLILILNQHFQFYEIIEPSWWFYLKVLIISGVYFLLRNFVLRSVGFVFKDFQSTMAWQLNIYLSNHLAGIVLLPLLVFTFYSKIFSFLWLTLGVYLLILIYRGLRAVAVSWNLTKFSGLYLFLYLCILEIIPVLVLIKVMLNYAAAS